MKKIVQNIALLTILLTILAVPAGMGAMEKNEVDFKGFGEALLNDGGYGLRDEKPLFGNIDDSVTPEYQHLRELEKRDAQVLIDIVCNKNTTTKQKINALDEALKTIDVNARDKNGWTTLHYAARCRHPELVEYLIEHGANVNAESNDGTTSLFNAVFVGSFAMVKYFVERGANINVECGHYYDTPLQWAAGIDNLAIVKYLILHGADPHARNKWGYTARGSASKQQIIAYLELAEDFYAVNNKQMTFEAFAQKHLINNNKVVYEDAKTLLKKIAATQQLNEQKLKEVENHLQTAADFYETDNKLKVFADYAEKYLVDGNAIRQANLTDVYNLLHLGTKEFFDEFVGFVNKNNLLTFGDEDGNEKEWMLFDCASRLGPKKDFWFKECCGSLGSKKPEFELTFDRALQKLPIQERDRLTKEKNKILQQKNGYLNIPKQIRMPNVKVEKELGDAAKKKLMDVKISFKYQNEYE